MIKSTKKAFTLVELIVVITILAILGTIAFISLQGYSADARNSKRTNDVASISQKISIEIVKGASASDFGTGSTTCKHDGTSDPAGTGVDFLKINEDSNSFKDPEGCNYNYVSGTATVSGTTITGEPTMIEEQLYEVYTWKENVVYNSSDPKTYTSAGRTLTGSIIPAGF